MARLWILILIILAICWYQTRGNVENFCDAKNFEECQPTPCIWHMDIGGSSGHCEESPYQWYC